MHSLVVSMGVQTGIPSQTKWPIAKQQPCCSAVGNILSSKSLKNMSAMREREGRREEKREREARESGERKREKQEKRERRREDKRSEREEERERETETEKERETGREREGMHPWHHPCFELFLHCITLFDLIVTSHYFIPFLCQSSSGSIAFLSSATEEKSSPPASCP